ncbi:hypothetical protein VitviT2T_018364 [Vitis vinifera]|uniref:Pentatricopeptide repeat-containing protein n=1 Tax=Vitis vinifera TaxID=29760 RepID=A0ABY9CXN1_VITVI|nr:hypothetical protein VitviT2T_018364 [Vitis vinifera]
MQMTSESSIVSNDSTCGKVDPITNSILEGYVQKGDVEEARLIFDQMPERNIIASNSMIVLLGKMGQVMEAWKLFNEMDEKDMVSWSALISGYEQNGMYEEALVMFIEMNANGMRLDEVVVVSVLSACTHLSIVKIGKMIHGLVIRMGIESYVNLQNALIHMYSGSGEIMDAEKLFNGSHNLD